ncbi:MAG TPA: FAD-dependent oxidoreductase, partial [Homoserinimonas sp.]|nr:FAD-dependent oxidoreductase [Homoserinimonas sp.]
TTDVLVIGGGVVGLATAWKAATEGMSVLVVSDPDRAEASRAAVGGLSFCPAEAVASGDEAMIGLSMDSKRTFPAFIRSLEEFSGVSTLHRKWPTLMLSLGDADEALMNQVETARSRVGLASIRLSAAECREAEPELAERIRSGLLLEDHDQIDSGALTESLEAACAKASVELRTGSVRGILQSAGRVAGVELSDGEKLMATNVVVAAGAWSGGIDGLPRELQNSVRPVAGQIVIVDGRPGQSLPRHDLRNAGVYLVTRSDGSVLMGATKEDKGFDQSPSARNVHSLLHAAAALWPGVGDCRWRETRVGMRPLSADQRPIVGPTSIEGLYAATGHFRNGIMFGAASAEAVVAMISGRESSSLFAPFSPSRMLAA